MKDAVRYTIFFLVLIVIFGAIFLSTGRQDIIFDNYITSFFILPDRPRFDQPSLNLEITPGEGPAGLAFEGLFSIGNTQQPLFDYSIKMWAPCQSYFEPITNWHSSNPEWDNTRILFSGILDRREAIGWYYAIPFVYTQCLYKWSIVTPGSNKEAKAPPILKPRESMLITFILQSNPNAHPGAYTLPYLDSFNFAGKSKIRFEK